METKLEHKSWIGNQARRIKNKETGRTIESTKERKIHRNIIE